jgi:peptidoglycan/LPS O-acetylase OafA/YrhL
VVNSASVTVDCNSVKAIDAAPNRIRALDGLRGLAVLLVVVEHLYTVVPEAPAGHWAHEVLKRVGALGYSGVDLFFVLSGCLIGGILLDHGASPRLLPTFFARRFFRIIPLYVLLLLTFFVAREIPSLRAMNYATYFDSPVPLWPYWIMLQNVAMAWKHDIGSFWLGPTWSLGVEEQFYLFMPLLVRNLSRRALVIFCLAAIVVCPLLRTAAMLEAQNFPAAVFLLPMRADSLLLGVLIAITLRSESSLNFVRSHRGAFIALLLALGTVLVVYSVLRLPAGSLPIATLGYTVIGLFYAGLVLWVLVFADGKIARSFSLRPLVGLGLISYFVYLFHTPVAYVLNWLILSRPPLNLSWAGGSVNALSFVVTVLLGALSYRYFEAPLLRIGHRFRYT